MTRPVFCVCAVLLGLATAAWAQTLHNDYSTLLGGSANDNGYAVAVDNTGAIYVAGFTESNDFPSLLGLQRFYAGGTGDLFVAKLKPDRSGFAFITYLGGFGGEGDIAERIGGIAVDGHGNVFVTGITRSADFPTTTGAFQPSIGSQFACDEDESAGLCGDSFVLKLSADGERLLYSTFIGGSDYDDARAIAVDSTGAAYITGMTASPDFPVTARAFQSQLRDVDTYVAKLSPDGSTLLYSTLIGGTGFDAGMAIALDSEGRAYVAGTTEGADFPVAHALQTKFGEPWDAFLLRVNATGTSLDFSTLLGGTGTDQGFGITLDPVGDIYIAGFTDSPDFPVRNAFQSSLGVGEGNGFVAKVHGDGSSIVYSTYLGGADGISVLHAIAVDASGHAYVAGRGGSDFPVVNSLLPYSVSSDGVVAKLTPDGSGVLYSTFLGGSGTDEINGIAHDPAGKVVIAGQTSSPDFPVSRDAAFPLLSGASDAFITVLSEVPTSTPIFSSAKIIDVGLTYVGQMSPPQSLVIRNLGTQALVLNSVVTSENVQAITDCGTVASGNTCVLSAALIVRTPGEQSGTITIYDNAPDSPQSISVHTTAVRGGDLELTPLNIGDPFNYYGRTAIPLTATITNHGPYNSTDALVRVDSESGVANCDPCYVGNIGAGSIATLRFTFLPSYYGTISLTARIEPSSGTPDLNSSNNEQNATVVNPRYTTSSTTVDFGYQIVNVTSDVRRITFSSLDEKPLQILVSASGDFDATTDCTGTLTCSADVVFRPTMAGKSTGVLLISDPVAGTIQSLAVFGTGLLAPHLALSASELSLTGSVGSSTWSGLTVTNDGSAPLFLNSINIMGNFTQSNRCAPSLMPGESCLISVMFSARQQGVQKGSVTIVVNTSEMFVAIPLTGVGIAVSKPSRPARSGIPPSLPAPEKSSKFDAQLRRSASAPVERRQAHASARSTSAARPLVSPLRQEIRSEIQSMLRLSGKRDR